MARTSRRAHVLALSLLLLGQMGTSSAQTLTNLPNLSTVTDTTKSSSTTSSSSSAASTTSSTTSSGDATTITNAPSLSSGTQSESAFHLTGLPTIEGAGIPTLVIPYTANAPFMQKSSLPEGTVFIAVGACLAFIGACVLLWRGLVVWSINRSVKRAALASVRGGSEKMSGGWGGPSGHHGAVAKTPLYKDDYGSSLSLDALNSAGKPMKPHFRDSAIERQTTPPANLFFSPTAKAASRDSQNLSAAGNRNSGYMPAGFYSAPSSQPAGGAGATTIGGSLAPYAQRHSTHAPSPPSSPGLSPTSRGSQTYRATSRDGLRSAGRDGAMSARNSYLDISGGRSARNSAIYSNGPTASDPPLSRAPSAYLEDLFENHGNGPRERF